MKEQYKPIKLDYSLKECISVYGQAEAMAKNPIVTLETMLTWLKEIDPRFSATSKRQALLSLFEYLKTRCNPLFLVSFKSKNEGMRDVASQASVETFNPSIYKLAIKDDNMKLVKFQVGLLTKELETDDKNLIGWMVKNYSLFPNSKARRTAIKLKRQLAYKSLKYFLMLYFNDGKAEGQPDVLIDGLIKAAPNYKTIINTINRWEQYVNQTLMKDKGLSESESYMIMKRNIGPILNNYGILVPAGLEYIIPNLLYLINKLGIEQVLYLYS